MESYPSVLPQPLRDSYSLEQSPNVRRSNMDSGRIRQRKVDNTTRLEISPVFRFSQHQYKIFCAWHRFKINQGADQFTIPLYGLNGLQNHVVQIINGEYSITHNDGFWDVSPTLEVFNPATMTEAELNAELS